MFLTNRDFLDCIDRREEFDFGSTWSKLPSGRQVIHRTGTLYVRVIQDRGGKAVVVAIANYKYLQKDETLQEKYEKVFQQLRAVMTEVGDFAH